MTDHAQRVPGIATTRADMMGLVLVLARFLLASEFMTYGVRKFLHPENIYNLIAANHLPGELVYLVYPWQFFFGWACFLGFQTRLAAIALFGFCIIAPSIFWIDNLENLTRDYATAGGFIFLFVYGPGRYSLDAKYGRDGGDIFSNIFGAIWKRASLIDGLLVAGRALMALPFLADAGKKIVHLGPQQELLASVNIAPVFVYVLIVGQLIFGTMLLIGYRTTLSASVLLAWSLVLGFKIHGVAGWAGFYTESYGSILYNWFQKNGGTLSSFYKDMEVIGALLMIIVFGPGRISKDVQLQGTSNAHESI